MRKYPNSMHMLLSPSGVISASRVSDSPIQHIHQLECIRHEDKKIVPRMAYFVAAYRPAFGTALHVQEYKKRL